MKSIVKVKKSDVYVFIYFIFVPTESSSGEVKVKETNFSLTVKDIIVFATGMPSEPPLGSLRCPL